jgi:hypothetical protein
LRFSRLFLAAALTLGAMTLGSALMPAATAFAQEVATTKVSVAPLVDSALAGISIVIGSVMTVGIGFLSARLYALTGISIEARHREALHSALMTGVNSALGKVSDLIGGHAIDVRSTAVAEAVTYVLQAVPDAVKALGLTPDRIAEMAGATLMKQVHGTGLPPQVGGVPTLFPTLDAARG